MLAVAARCGAETGDRGLWGPWEAKGRLTDPLAWSLCRTIYNLADIMAQVLGQRVEDQLQLL